MSEFLSDTDLAGRLEAADRFGVVEQLLVGHLIAALEEPPPPRPRFPPVILEQLAGEPPDRSGLLAFDQALPQRLALAAVLLVGSLLRFDDAPPTPCPPDAASTSQSRSASVARQSSSL